MDMLLIMTIPFSVEASKSFVFPGRWLPLMLNQLTPNHHFLTMLTRQKEIYTIWCVFSDEVSLFRIKVESDEPVIALKEKIKDANPSLAEFAAHHLKLYQVEISVHGDLKASVDEKLSQNPTELQAWPKLAAVFKEGLKDDVVHIIVQSPISGK
jgi:hypothetical protein